MAAEIFMSCTCTSVVRGTAKGLCFLPSPSLCRSLSGNSSHLGQVTPALPSLTGHPAQPTTLGTPARPQPLLLGARLIPCLALSLPCPIVMDWTCGAVAACLTLCALLELCKDRLVAHLFLGFPRGLAWCGCDLERGPLYVQREAQRWVKVSALALL